MTTILWCLLAVSAMPILLSFVGGYYRNKQLGVMDNNEPRAQIPALTGAGSRAYAAQQNAWEALAVFTAAVVSAWISQADPQTATNLALGFVACRIAHAAFYLADLATLRSLAFVGGMFCAVWLFVQGLI